MKLSFVIATVVASIIPLKAQVGINTSEPTRSLDVNGNLKVVELSNKTGVTDYRKIAVANASNGNVDYMTFPSINQNETKNVEVTRTIYLGSNPDNNKTCSCGEITFYLNSNRKAYFKLNSDKVFKTNSNASSIILAYGVKRWDSQSYNYQDISNKIFTTGNFGTYQTLDSSDLSANNSIRIYTIVLPNQNNLYRITLSSLLNSNSLTNPNIYSLICEKFYTQTL